MAPRRRPAGTLLAPAVQEAINALKLAPEDAGAVQLAHSYAKAIDEAGEKADMLDRLGPKLLACLESLGATPRARATRGGGASAPVASKLDELRARRAKRAGAN